MRMLVSIIAGGASALPATYVAVLQAAVSSCMPWPKAAFKAVGRAVSQVTKGGLSCHLLPSKLSSLPYTTRVAHNHSLCIWLPGKSDLICQPATQA
jgi:hypothetical protein